MSDQKINCPYCGKTIIVMINPIDKSVHFIKVSGNKVVKTIKGWFK